jgi:hypothetical protein
MGRMSFRRVSSCSASKPQMPMAPPIMRVGACRTGYAGTGSLPVCPIPRMQSNFTHMTRDMMDPACTAISITVQV